MKNCQVKNVVFWLIYGIIFVKGRGLFSYLVSEESPKKLGFRALPVIRETPIPEEHLIYYE